MYLDWDVICTGGAQKESYDGFDIYLNPEAKLRYSSNFMVSWAAKDLLKFQVQEEMLTEQITTNDMDHLQIYFAFNTSPSAELLAYLVVRGYHVGLEEVYVVDPQYFLVQNTQQNTTVKVAIVTVETLADFAEYAYREALTYGEAYAHFIGKEYVPKLFAQPDTTLWMAVLQNRIVGTAYLFESADFYELDNFTVVPAFQRKGIGTTLQCAIMEQVGNKPVMLLADGQDSARVMYQQQGYILQGFYYTASLKLVPDDI